MFLNRQKMSHTPNAFYQVFSCFCTCSRITAINKSVKEYLLDFATKFNEFFSVKEQKRAYNDFRGESRVTDRKLGYFLG